MGIRCVYLFYMHVVGLHVRLEKLQHFRSWSLVHTVPVSSPGVDIGANRNHTVATLGGHALNRDKSCWTGDHREVAPVVFNCFYQPGLTGTYRGAKQRRLLPGHHRSFSGMNRFSTVRPPGETVVNRHEICPKWRLPVWSRCVTEEFRPSPDSCYGLTR